MATKRSHHGNAWRGRQQSFANELLTARKLLQLVNPPDTAIVPAQWFSQARFVGPIERLLVATMEQVFRDYCLPKFRVQIREWVESGDDAPFGLSWLAQHLDIDPGDAQARLVTYMGKVDGGWRGYKQRQRRAQR